MNERHFVLDPNLEPYATERQWELLTVWAAHKNREKAALALGVAKNLLSQAKRRVEAKAAARGYIPDGAFSGVGVPPGYVLRGQSALVDKEGNLRERWDKTRMEGLDPDEARKLPDPKKTIKLSTLTDAEGRVLQQWVAERPDDVAREHAWKLFAQELAQSIPRLEPLPPPVQECAEDRLAAYPIGDHHLGMLAWKAETGASYDLEIGRQLLLDAFSYLTNATQTCAQALLVFLGDFMHYDSFETVTPTNRNNLDSDTRFSKLVGVAVMVMRGAIDMALRRHGRVHVIVEAGNHDLASTVFLVECLRIAYENEPRVTIDTSPMHYHYYRFGQVLIGTHHGHGTKMQNLPLIMAADRPADWGVTSHRYFWTGHIHTSKVQPAISAQDYSGCVVESFRVLAPPDAWAAQKGYRPHRGMVSIVIDREHGEIARHKVRPDMLGGTDG